MTSTEKAQRLAEIFIRQGAFHVGQMRRHPELQHIHRFRQRPEMGHPRGKPALPVHWKFAMWATPSLVKLAHFRCDFLNGSEHVGGRIGAGGG